MSNSPFNSPSLIHNDLFTKEWKIAFACVLAFLVMVFIIVCYYIRHTCRHEQRNRRITAVIHVSSILNDNKLEHKVLASLPIFVYPGLNQEEKLECAICLMDFREGDKGRRLPRCCHRFHMECVDMWFETHSSCPLCRLIVEVETV